VALGHNCCMAGLVRGDRLKALRKEADLNLIDVAVATGVDRSHLNKMERGQKQPSLAALDALARYFAVSPDYLLGWSDDRLPGQGGQVLECEDKRALFASFDRLPDHVRQGIIQIIRGIRGGTPEPPPARKPDDAA